MSSPKRPILTRKLPYVGPKDGEPNDFPGVLGGVGTHPYRLCLSDELAVYRDRSAEFERDHMGEFVAIKGDRVLGFWPDHYSAIEGAIAIVGPTDILVREVGKPQAIVWL